MALARIILLDMPKKTFLFSDEIVDILASLKDRLGVKSQTAAVELALRHLLRTLEKEEPVYYGRSKTQHPPKSA